MGPYTHTHTTETDAEKNKNEIFYPKNHKALNSSSEIKSFASQASDETTAPDDTLINSFVKSYTHDPSKLDAQSPGPQKPK